MAEHVDANMSQSPIKARKRKLTPDKWKKMLLKQLKLKLRIFCLIVLLIAALKLVKFCIILLTYILTKCE